MNVLFSKLVNYLVVDFSMNHPINENFDDIAFKGSIDENRGRNAKMHFC